MFCLLENSRTHTVNKRESKGLPVPSINCDVAQPGLQDVRAEAVIISGKGPELISTMFTRFHVACG